jgi:ribosomal protein L24E
MNTEKKDCIKNQIDGIALNPYVRKGTFIAHQLGWEGVTQTLQPDESVINCLDISENGVVYGGTGVRAAHLFESRFTGSVGFIRDLGGQIENAVCAAVCCHKDKVVAFVNDHIGVRVVIYNYDTPFGADPIQEFWRFDYSAIDIGYIFKSDNCINAIRDNSREKIIGVTQNTLFSFNVSTRKASEISSLSKPGRLIADSCNDIYGLDDSCYVWRYTFANDNLDRRALKLPKGLWNAHDVKMAADKRHVYISDSEGNVYYFSRNKEISFLFKTHQKPVSTMVVTPDARIFGFCGTDMQNMFAFDLQNGNYENLGVAVSTHQRVRYGYQFSDSVVGMNGEIFFGESDNSGHLWTYCPWLLERNFSYQSCGVR